MRTRRPSSSLLILTNARHLELLRYRSKGFGLVIGQIAEMTLKIKRYIDSSRSLDHVLNSIGLGVLGSSDARLCQRKSPPGMTLAFVSDRA
jgi:hypothetical protein